MVSDGLIEVQDTTVVKSAMKERRSEPGEAGSGAAAGEGASLSGI